MRVVLQRDGGLVTANNDPDSQNIAAGASEGSGGIAGNGVLGGPPDPPLDPHEDGDAESVPPDDTGLATGADEDPGYDAVRPAGGSIDRDTGA